MPRARSPSPPSTPIVGTSRHINSFDNLGLLGSRYKSLSRNGRSPTKIASPCFNFSRLNATGRNGSPARSARRRARSNVEPRSSTGSCNIRVVSLLRQTCTQLPLLPEASLPPQCLSVRKMKEHEPTFYSTETTL